MTIALTGASGFVGRHALDELLSRGLPVVATYRPGYVPTRKASGLQWVELDLATPPVDAYDRLGRPEVLLHLAWGGLTNYRSMHHIYEELPKHYSFLAGLVHQGLPALVATGTCLEYGMQCGSLSADAPTQPVIPYGFAKDALHKQLQYLQGAYSFRFTWARLFYMYGQGQSVTSLLPTLEKAVTDGKRTFPMSGGEQLRDYLPVTEVARRLVVHALARQDSGAVNVCSGAPISVRQLVENWIAENNWNIIPLFGQLAYPDYEPMAFWGIRADEEL